MDKGNKLKYFIIIISIISTLACVGLFFTMQNNNNLINNTTINVNGETNVTLKAKIDGLYPGKTEIYVVSLKGSTAKEYYVTLNFFEDNGGALKRYLNVKIETVNGVIEKPLQDLLNEEPVFLGQGLTEILLSYTMPIDTGDEAQGASVVFYVEFNAKNVE